MTNDKATPRPWKQQGILVRGGHSGDEIVCRTQLPQKGTTMTHYNNAEFIVKAVNNHDALLEACKIARQYIDGKDTKADAIKYLDQAINQATETK